MDVERTRWFTAQEQEKKSIESSDADDIREWLRVRRHTWRSLLDLLKDEIDFANSKRILDIGSGPTSIFLALRQGERYAVDPNFEHLFSFHPFIREIKEYKDVNFIASPIEDVVFDEQFDLIFMINVLDHCSALKPVTDKIDELLTPQGNLVVVVDCYTDSLVKSIVSLFDVDIPHPHHFVVEDVIKLFSTFELKKQDKDNIQRIFGNCTFRGHKAEIEIYRVDKFIARMMEHIKRSGREWDILFVSKYVLCYNLALLVALLRKMERPIHPLKKPQLLLFRKKTVYNNT